MSTADWTALGSSLGSGDVARGVTAGLTPPNGGGSFVYAANAITAVAGAYGLYATPQAPNTNFNPLLSGGDIKGCVQKGIANGASGYSGFLFMALQGTDVDDVGYLLGLSDAGAAHLELRKGILATGLPDEAPGGTNTILRRSTATFAAGTWVHIRLEAVVNLNGDVVLNCYQSDLTAHAVTSPVWTAIPGMAQFIDDVAAINTGTVPLIGGRAGWAGTFDGVTRRVFVDHLQLIKQV